MVLSCPGADLFLTNLLRSYQLTNPVGIARNGHPCGSFSRWRNFAFSAKEGDSGVINPQRFIAKYNNLTDSFITIMLNGEFEILISCHACERYFNQSMSNTLLITIQVTSGLL